METKITFDINELIQIDNDICESYDGIENNLTKMKSNFDELQTNVTGTQVNNLIATITENITAINTKMDASFERLNSFLKGQMENYAYTYDGALAIFKDALAFIDSNF